MLYFFCIFETDGQCVNMCLHVCSEPKRVKCSVCDRRFRNLPALNGHMRLHGGYMKKVCRRQLLVII